MLVYRPKSRRFPGLGLSLSDLAGAITRMEGSCSAPGVCVNNNPGNLRAGPGQIGTDSRGFAVFPDFGTGQAALLRQEQLNIDRGLTLSEFFGGKPGVYAGYAPAADRNQPNVYTSNVAGWLGVPSDVPLASILDGGAAPDVSVSASVPSDVSQPMGFDFTGSEGSISPMAIAGLALAGVALVLAIS